MVYIKKLGVGAMSFVLIAIAALGSQGVAASTINLNAPAWLGSLELNSNQLNSVKKAIEKALTAPIDVEQQCGEVRLDCVVRAAREWVYQGDKYREIVIYLHTIGQASKTISQENGKWPRIATGQQAKAETKKK